MNKKTSVHIPTRSKIRMLLRKFVKVNIGICKIQAFYGSRMDPKDLENWNQERNTVRRH